MSSIFHKISEERKSPAQPKTTQPRSIFHKIAEERVPQQEPTNLMTRAGKEFASSALGSYGDIARLAGLNKQELPGTQARIQREAQATPEELIYHVEDDVIPSSGRLPTSEDVLQAMGGVTEAKKPIERLVSKTARAGGGGLALGGPAAVLPSVAGATVGESVKELTGSPVAGTIADIATNIKAAGGKSAKEVVKKPSGLSVRQFEKLQKPRNVTPERFEKIVNTVEKEARDISENILKGNKTRIAMKEFPDFNDKVAKGFEKVRDLAKEIPYDFDGSNLVREYHKKARERISKGFPEAAAQKAYEKEMKYLIKKHAGKSYKTDGMVDLYRDNNKSLSGMFDKSASSNINDAKKTALLDFQEVIRDNFDKVLPDTEFSNLFKTTNKIYSEKMSIDKIENYLDKVFSGDKINFKEAHKYFESNKVRGAIKSVYGKESADAFTNLQKDLLSYENGMKLIKASEKKNVNLKDYAHLIIPEVGTVKIGMKNLNIFYDTMLNKPQTMIKWNEALKDIRKGAFQAGARKLEEVSREFDKIVPQSPQES